MKKIMVGLMILVFLYACSNDKPPEQKEEPATTTTPVAETKMQPAEFADPKYMQMGKDGLAALSKGDVAGWMNSFADNAVYVWNNLDSLAGKPAISEYWTKRRAEVIDSISFTNQIFLPVKVNQPQSVEAPGVWLLSWYQVNAKYKNGKHMTQLIHSVMHFNSDDKIDRKIQYIDRASINAALKK